MGTISDIFAAKAAPTGCLEYMTVAFEIWDLGCELGDKNAQTVVSSHRSHIAEHTSHIADPISPIALIACHHQACILTAKGKGVG